MTPENFMMSLAVVRTKLSAERNFVEAADADYGSLFQFEHTPCCIPLPVLAWVNPTSEGVFVRVLFPATGPVQNVQRLTGSLNEINWSLPVGAFAAELSSGEVRFKSAVFFGDHPLNIEMLTHLLESTLEFVNAHYHAVLHAVTGVEHVH